MLVDLICDEHPGGVVEGVAIPDQAFFERWVSAALQHVADASAPPSGSRIRSPSGPMRHEVSLRLASSEEMQSLNEAWRGKDAVTNVLSFPADMPPLSGSDGVSTLVLGDLIICPAVVQREATLQEKPLDAHWAHLIVHGTLHLRGLDHESEEEAETMEALEIRILSSQNIPDPYGARAHPS